MHMAAVRIDAARHFGKDKRFLQGWRSQPAGRCDSAASKSDVAARRGSAVLAAMLTSSTQASCIAPAAPAPAPAAAQTQLKRVAFRMRAGFWRHLARIALLARPERAQHCCCR